VKRKLSPQRLAELLNEMELADQFTEKRWAARFGISVPYVRYLRRQARERRRRLLIPNQSQDLHVVCFSTPSK
jgi:AraC-like DNA-binding protein